MAIRSILVTGGAGYIGSHLVDRLVLQGYAVTVLDSLEPQVHRSGTWPSYANTGARYVRGDVRDRNVFEPLVVGSDAVVHFGAAVSVGRACTRWIATRREHPRHRAPARHPGQREAQLGRSCLVPLRRSASTAKALTRATPSDRWRRASIRPSSWWRATGAALPAFVGGLRVDPDAGRQGALPGQHLFDDSTTRRDGAAHRQDLWHSGLGPRFFNVYGPRQSLSNPYAGVAAIWLSRLMNGKQPVVFRRRRPAARLRLGPRCRRLPVLMRKSRAPTAARERRSADGHDPGDRGLLRVLLGSPIEPQVTNNGRKFDIRQTPSDITRARTTPLFRAEGVAGAGVRRVDRRGPKRRRTGRKTFLTARSRNSRTGTAGAGVPHSVIRAARHTVADGLLVVAVFATAFFYRFNKLGGALGGFTNDDSATSLADARVRAASCRFRISTIPAGFSPTRSSWLAQWAGGYNCAPRHSSRWDAVARRALHLVLARKASGSTSAALLAIVHPHRARRASLHLSRKSCSTPSASRSRGPMQTIRGRAAGRARLVRRHRVSCSGTTTSCSRRILLLTLWIVHRDR